MRIKQVNCLFSGCFVPKIFVPLYYIMCVLDENKFLLVIVFEVIVSSYIKCSLIDPIRRIPFTPTLSFGQKIILFLPSHRKRKLYKVVERYRRNAMSSFDLAPSTPTMATATREKNNDGVSVYISINLSEVDSHLRGWRLMKKTYITTSKEPRRLHRS